MLIDKYPPGMMVNFLMLIGRAWNVRNGVNEEKLLVVFLKKRKIQRILLCPLVSIYNY
jgi:hypothetical protein